MPKTLHAELAARSDAAGTSLNQYIVTALARAVSAEGGTAAPEARDRSIRRALMVNAVVVALAAATAIVILVVALR